MKITVGQLKQIVKEEIQKEMIGLGKFFGKKDGKSQSKNPELDAKIKQVEREFWETWNASRSESDATGGMAGGPSKYEQQKFQELVALKTERGDSDIEQLKKQAGYEEKGARFVASGKKTSDQKDYDAYGPEGYMGGQYESLNRKTKR